MENSKNTKTLIILLIVIIILSVVCFFLVTRASKDNTDYTANDEPNQNVSGNIEKDNLDTTTILEKLNGVWGHDNYMISIEKDINKYFQCQYGTDGGINGTISNIKEVDTNKYELEVFIPASSGDMGITEEETKIISIELDTTKNVIINFDNEYIFITEDHSDRNKIDTFFNK